MGAGSILVTRKQGEIAELEMHVACWDIKYFFLAMKNEDVLTACK